MARPRNPKRDKAFEIWKKSNGTRKLKDIATDLELTDTQIRKWKNEDKWDEKLNSNVTKSNSNVPKRTRGAPKGNSNAKGNSGGAAPKGNQNAMTHGFFSKFLPPETLEIMEIMNERSPADLIWDQIQIQYAAIIRAQQIMFVRDQDDMTKEIKKEKSAHSDTMVSEETEWEIQFAWDKHATFLNAQSRAMSELRSLIKQFNEMAHEDDERRLKLEQMQLGIEKTKAEIERITNGDNDGDDQLIDDWVEAVTDDEE